MKKALMISLIIVSMVLVGCGSKKKTVKSVKDEDDEEIKITLKLGEENTTFKEESVTCGEHTIQSNLVFSNELDENGYKGSYELYECNEGNINLETATGYYIQDDETVTFIDTYGQTLEFELTSDNTIELKNGSKTYKTFTK